MKNIILNNKLSFCVISLCLLIVIIFSSLVIIYDNLYIDSVVYEFLVENFKSDFVDAFMINITKLGNTNFVVLFSFVLFVIFMIFIKNKLISFMYIFSVSFIVIINQFLKMIIRRDRPNIFRMIEIGGYSFPSGHAMVSTILYGLFAYFMYRFINKKWLANSIVAINILIILLIGISRIYLGVHYFSDVICGVLISIIFLVIVINIFEKKCFSQNCP